jgi:group I intron endonuclease
MEYIFEGKSNKGGVYKLTNKNNGRVYIGSAKTFKTRWHNHTASLRRQKHHNKYLQADFDICGEEAFVFEVLEVVEGSKPERLSTEQRYIDQYYNKKTCYNLCKKALSPEGVQYPTIKTKYANVQLISPTCERYTDITSIEEFAKNHDLNSKSLWKLLNKQTPSVKGWKLADFEKKKRDPSTFLKGENHPLYNKHHTEKAKQKNRLSHLGKNMGIAHSNSKVYDNIELLSPNGLVITRIECLADFCRLHDLEPTKLCAVLKGRRKSTKGWKLATISAEIL